VGQLGQTKVVPATREAGRPERDSWMEADPETRLIGVSMALIVLVMIKTAIDLGLLLNIDEWVASRAMKRSI